jgi:hypothetical protein
MDEAINFRPDGSVSSGTLEFDETVITNSPG